MPIDTMPSPQKEMIAAVNAFLTPLQKGKTPLSRALRLGDMAIIDADCSTDWPVVAGKAGKAFCAALPHPKPACYDWDSGTFYLGVEPKKLGAAEAPVLLAELFQALRALDGEPRPEPDNLRETLRNSAFLERALPIFPRIAKAEAALMKPPKTPTLAWVEALFALFDALEDFERAEYGKPPSGAADPAEYRPPDHEALYDCWRLKINFYALPQYYEAQKDKVPFEGIGIGWAGLSGSTWREIPDFLKGFRAYLWREVEKFLTAQGPGMSEKEKAAHRQEKTAEIERQVLAKAGEELAMRTSRFTAAKMFPGGKLPSAF
ncbi:MAG: hypothetical protein R3D78_15070 [Paracoccaceae bacterium]